MEYYINGEIPAKVKIFGVPKCSIGWHWENHNIQRYAASGEKKKIAQKVIWANVASSKNRSMCKTAEKRAVELARRTKSSVVISEVENKPMTGLRVVGIEKHRESVEHVVVLPGNLALTMPYDSMMDAITLGGIEDGVLKGEYIFALADGKIQLVRVGSTFHKAVLEATKRAQSSKIEKLDLVPGHLYRNKQGHFAVFIGFVSTINYQFKYNELQKRLIMGTALEHVPSLEEYKTLDISKNVWDMATVWCNVNVHNKRIDPKDLKKQVDEYFSNSWNFFGIELLKTHSYIEEVPNFDIDIPLDFFERMRRAANNDIEEFLKRHKEETTSSRYYQDKANFAWNLQYNSITPFDFEKKYRKEIEELSNFIRTTRHEKNILAKASWANVIIYGMKPIVNLHIEKIVKKYSK